MNFKGGNFLTILDIKQLIIFYVNVTSEYNENDMNINYMKLY